MPSRIDIGPEGGPFVAINENSNDLELQDINGNVIAVWDETEGQWDLNNNSLTNINAIDASSATLDSVEAEGISTTITGTRNDHLLLIDADSTYNPEDSVDYGTINADGSAETIITLDGSRATGLLVVTYGDVAQNTRHHSDLVILAGVSESSIVGREERDLNISPNYGFVSGSADQITTTVTYESSLDYTVRFIGHSTLP